MTQVLQAFVDPAVAPGPIAALPGGGGVRAAIDATLAAHAAAGVPIAPDQ
jgi:hypothetical protein